MRSTLNYLQREIEALATHPEVLLDDHRRAVVCAEWLRRIRQAVEGTPRADPIVPRGVLVVEEAIGRPMRVCPPGHPLGQVDRWAAVLADGQVLATCTAAPPLIRWCRTQEGDVQFLFDLSLLERP